MNLSRHGSLAMSSSSKATGNFAHYDGHVSQITPNAVAKDFAPGWYLSELVGRRN
jgi:prepilin-type processing-associated H-X9-DG protein